MKPLAVNYSWTPDRKELYKLYDDILDTGELTNNKKYVQLLEKTLVEQGHARYAFTTCNGTMALQIAINALNIFSGEIITTPHTFIATASSIVWQSCTPVFVDIDPETLCIDPALIEQKITANTRAILAVHVYGGCCDIDAIEAIALRHSLPTIYDASHAFGSMYKGKSVFGFGTISTASLHAFKIVSAVEGGVVFCNDEELADRIYKIRYFGKNKDNEEELVGINGKMSEFNAAFAMLSLANLDAEIKARNSHADYYLAALKNLHGFRFPNYKHSSFVNHAYFPVIFPSENKLVESLNRAKADNIILKRMFYPSLNKLSFLSTNSGTVRISEDISLRIMCLPIYKGLTVAELDRVINSIIG